MLFRIEFKANNEKRFNNVFSCCLDHAVSGFRKYYMIEYGVDPKIISVAELSGEFIDLVEYGNSFEGCWSLETPKNIIQ